MTHHTKGAGERIFSFRLLLCLMTGSKVKEEEEGSSPWKPHIVDLTWGKSIMVKTPSCVGVPSQNNYAHLWDTFATERAVYNVDNVDSSAAFQQQWVTASSAAASSAAADLYASYRLECQQLPLSADSKHKKTQIHKYTSTNTQIYIPRYTSTSTNTIHKR